MGRMGALVAIVVVAAFGCSGGGSAAGGGSSTAAKTIRIVNQNLLHGTACPTASNRCDIAGRAALFVRQLERAQCPELVAIEEANPTTERALQPVVPGTCGYKIVYDGDPSQDRELVLTTLRVLGSERRRLAGPLRTAYWVRVASDAGPVDLVATHLASGSDDRPCDAAACPPPCKVSDTMKTCQGRQAAAFLHDKRGSHSIAILAGDLNARPGEPTITALTHGGLVDTHRRAGNPECSVTAADQCTSGRIDDSLVDMSNANSKETERIDYIFLTPVPRCRLARPTGIFAPKGGPSAPGSALVFPADHTAVEATFSCRTSAADLAAAKPPLFTTTTRAAATVSPALRQKVTAAFTTLFAPNPDTDVQLSTLENAAALRDSFIARKQQVGVLADQTSVRIDSFVGATPTTVDVMFSILLSGNVVLDALPGQVKLIHGKWFVTTKTYCQVATLGTTTVPEACKR